MIDPGNNINSRLANVEKRHTVPVYKPNFDLIVQKQVVDCELTGGI
jgi:hypothetical protein